ncbi:two-component sensor histidine kinase [Azospirillum fermentarium]|uniref:sensor histidine kinase n=1 Tax=Azospirillum fermentarium TaxID=1233114 RepID=UPI002228023F|nr:sensor histidine kinase [Azospirillum fermentarium]MCW2245861.1 two-component sensor histidine kinase [Azospirillum fermentarium]
MGYRTHRSLRFNRTVGWVTLAVALAMLLLIGVLSQRVRHEINATAESGAAAATRLLSEHAARLFDTADQVVMRATEQVASLSWDEIETSHALWERLDQEQSRYPYLGDLWINDGAGRLRLTTAAFPVPEAHAADRDFFTVHRDGFAGPTISERFMGRVTRSPLFMVTRRLDDGAGAFRGVIGETIETRYFSEFYSTLDLPLMSSIAMIRPGDTHPIAAFSRMGGAEDGIAVAGAVPDVPAAVRAALAAGEPEGILRADGETLVYRRIGPWPVYALVRIDGGLVDRQWRQAVLPYTLAGVVVVLAVAGIAAATLRRIRAEVDARHGLEERVRERTATLHGALARMEEAVRQKDLLMRESNHRIKNSLQLVSSILTMHGVALKNTDIRSHFAEASRRVAAIADVHELLYRGDSLSCLCFRDYLENLCRSMRVSSLPPSEGWEVHLDADPVVVSADQAVALGIIVGELLTNCAKYAYPAPGPKPVFIVLKAEEGGAVRLSVADQGVGLPPEGNGSHGGTPPRGTGLGMRVVKALSVQIGARIAIDRTPPGVCYTLTFTPRTA